MQPQALAISVLAFTVLVLIAILVGQRLRYLGIIDNLLERYADVTVEVSRANRRAAMLTHTLDLLNANEEIRLPERRHFNEGGYDHEEVLSWNACISEMKALNPNVFKQPVLEAEVV